MSKKGIPSSGYKKTSPTFYTHLLHPPFFFFWEEAKQKKGGLKKEELKQLELTIGTMASCKMNRDNFEQL